jgi:formylglycine-generating enzyme required for sulfatase activity
MKKIILLLPLALLLSCVGTKENFDQLRKFPKPKFTPPGTIWLRGNLFIDEAEVSNFSYQEFLVWLKRKNTPQYYLMLPDTDCWTHSDVGSADKLIQNYFPSTAYRNYPVVGVSYQQAQEFCKWRTDRVNEFLYIKENHLKFSLDSEDVYLARAPKKVKYRLPFEEEWEYAAAAGLEYCNFPMGYESIKSYNVPVNNTLEYHNYFTKDFRAIDRECNRPIEVKCPTTAVYSGKANRYGLYQMMGNVSEMMADGSLKGLNYTEPIFTIERSETEKGSYTINSVTWTYKITKKYKKPEPWIGFRCICEVE